MFMGSFALASTIAAASRPLTFLGFFSGAGFAAFASFAGLAFPPFPLAWGGGGAPAAPPAVGEPFPSAASMRARLAWTVASAAFRAFSVAGLGMIDVAFLDFDMAFSFAAL